MYSIFMFSNVLKLKQSLKSYLHASFLFLGTLTFASGKKGGAVNVLLGREGG
jgi:hypothetical protein